MTTRRILWTAVAVVAVIFPAVPSFAQRQGTSPALEAEPDLFKPYAAPSPSAVKSSGSSRKPTRPAAPLPPPHRLYAAAVNRGANSYYPALRRGYGPNQNVVDPHTLCVPGRRAVIMRGRQ